MAKQHEQLEALMKAFDDFLKRRLIEAYNDAFLTSYVFQSNQDMVIANNQILALWLSHTATEALLCQEALTPYF